MIVAIQGSWTIARPIAVPEPLRAYGIATLASRSSMRPSMPVGSTKIEIYFSIVQRKVLTPNDFPNLDAVAERLLDFQYYWATTSRPFEWKFTRRDLDELLVKLSTPR